MNQQEMENKEESSYEEYFVAKVNEALADTRPTLSHEQVMQNAQTIIDNKKGIK